MDLELTEEQQDFRSEVCRLLCESAVQQEAAAAYRLPDHAEPGLLEVYRRLGERGWLAPNWEPEYGGIGATLVEKAILTEEMILHGVPDVTHTLSIDIVGLAIHQHGTAEQKRRWLPPLAAGTSVGAVLFSEPDVGSDLSALRTRAERSGDGWRLTGRKRYSLKSHLADFALCAARTSEGASRFSGITVFIVPMRSAGVQVAPLWSVSDERFNEVTLTGPVMGPDDVLGAVDEGWHVIGQVLALERTGIELEAKSRRLVQGYLDRLGTGGGPVDPVLAETLVRLDAEATAGQLLSWRAIGALLAGGSIEVPTAMAKWHTSEVARTLAALGPDVCGVTAGLAAGDPDAVEGWRIESAYRDAPGFTLASGTSEMMLSIVAAAALRLGG